MINFPEFIEKCKKDIRDMQACVQDIWQHIKLPPTYRLLDQTPITEKLDPLTNLNGHLSISTLLRWYKLAQEEEKKKTVLLKKHENEEVVKQKEYTKNKTQNENKLDAQKNEHEQRKVVQRKTEDYNKNEVQRQLKKAEAKQLSFGEALYANNEVLRKRKIETSLSSISEPKRKKKSSKLKPMIELRKLKMTVKKSKSRHCSPELATAHPTPHAPENTNVSSSCCKTLSPPPIIFEHSPVKHSKAPLLSSHPAKSQSPKNKKQTALMKKTIRMASKMR